MSSSSSNRCIFCNKTFKSPHGVTQHEGTCQKQKNVQNSKRRHDDIYFYNPSVYAKKKPKLDVDSSEEEDDKDDHDDESELDDAQRYFQMNAGSNDEFSDTYDPTLDYPEDDTKMPYQHHSTVPLTPGDGFQIELAELLSKHKTSLKLFDEVNELIRNHSNGNKLMFHSDDLTSRKTFLKKLETNMQTKGLRPTDVTVNISCDRTATVSVFDIEAMIMSLLHDENLMRPENLAPDYDIHTGKSTATDNTVYGEVHTGDDWEKARQHYCGDHDQNMPIGLIFFGDKTHLDRHGCLAATPIMFTLSIFNREARCSPQFWRPLAYIPNLGYGLITKEEKDVLNKLNDEQQCIRAAFKSLVELTNRKGIRTTVANKEVVCKVWIHFIIGDTEGNNKWLGHYNHHGNTAMPYRDCQCPYCDMDKSNPTCLPVTPQFVQDARSRSQSALRNISKHNVNIAFLDMDLPVSDLINHVYGMFPPEILHTTNEGITKYIIEVLKDMLSEDNQVIIETYHRFFHHCKGRNSERDVPPSSSRSGFFSGSNGKAGTFVNACERPGNMFILLCLAHTKDVQDILRPVLRENDCTVDQFIQCLKDYISLEAWFHESNSKAEVNLSRPAIAEVITSLKKVFPRQRGQGWKLVKLHGLTKMQHFMCKYGCAINFFGGPGESNHKKFLKNTGNNTQRRPDSFVSQVGTRMYEQMVIDFGKLTMDQQFREKFKSDNHNEVKDDIWELSSRYTLKVDHITVRNNNTHTLGVRAGNGARHVKVPIHAVNAICRLAVSLGHSGTFSCQGYSCLKVELDGRKEIFRATDRFHIDGKKWHDWCMVEFEPGVEGEDNLLYPCKILTYFQFDKSLDKSQEKYAVVHCSLSPLSMSKLEDEFCSKFALGSDPVRDICVVSVESIAYPLFVFRNSVTHGHRAERFAVIPKRKWGRYFGKRIRTYEIE